jgi:hypothetical protein
MKIFSILLFLFSTKLFACPNIGGNYTCQASTETWSISIIQTKENGITVYKWTGGQNEGTYIADGKARPHKVIANEEEINGTISTKCSGPKVTIQFLADYHGTPIDFSENINYSNGVLTVIDTTKVGGGDFDTTTYECTVNN